MNGVYQFANLTTDARPFQGKWQMSCRFGLGRIPDNNLDNLLGMVACVPDGISRPGQLGHILGDNVPTRGGRKIFSQRAIFYGEMLQAGEENSPVWLGYSVGNDVVGFGILSI